MNHTVDISDYKVSNSQDDVLITYALGSCLGVTVYDPVAQVGGMIHCMLPLSKIDREKATKLPAMFIDTGIPTLFKEAYKSGAQKERLIVKVAGGSAINDVNGHFKIGERNFMVLRKILWKNNIMIKNQDVGGSISRTLYLEIKTGHVSIRTGQEITPL